MFEAEIERTKIQLAELLLPRAGGGLHLADVLDHPTVDRAYKEFLRAEVEWLLYQDRIQRQLNLPIDPTDPLFRRVWGQVEDYVRRHARFERKHALSLFDAAVKSVLNYRVRPRVTLKWFVYRGEPTKPVCEILLRLRYFADYPYIRTGFEQWMRERELDSTSTHIMPVFEFERLIKQLDDEHILDLSTSQFIELLDPVFRFFNETPTPPALEAIPIEALIVFLDDKDIQVIAQKFERMLYHDGIRTVTRDTILRVVDQVLQELEQEQGSQTPLQTSTVTETTTFETDSSSVQEDEPADLEPVHPAPITETVEQVQVDEPQPVVEEEPVVDSAPSAVEEEQVGGVLPMVPDDAQEHSPDDDQSSAIDLPEISDAALDEIEAAQTPSALDEVEIASVTGKADAFPLDGADEPTEDALQAAVETVEVWSPEAVEPEQISSSQDSEHRLHGDELEMPLSEDEPAPSTDAEEELLDDDVVEINALLAHPEQSQGSFETATPEQRRALEREFMLTTTDSQTDQPEPVPDDHSTASSQTAKEFTQSSAAVAELSTDLDQLLESGLQHVRVRVPEQLAPQPLLSDVLSEELKEVVLKKLCAHDVEQYNSLLRRLDAATSVRSALNEFDRFLAEHALDPTIKAAQELRLALVKRYTMA
ncbi:MAG: hypothetical protein KatS3mg039_1164 [Candidatus Kapaibacterium sp.]|nr:MAG: hypothetical protein KatS3mg039_1164 [Candidatus Kapabacteria bacterium]